MTGKDVIAMFRRHTGFGHQHDIAEGGAAARGAGARGRHTRVSVDRRIAELAAQEDRIGRARRRLAQVGCAPSEPVVPRAIGDDLARRDPATSPFALIPATRSAPVPV